MGRQEERVKHTPSPHHHRRESYRAGHPLWGEEGGSELLHRPVAGVGKVIRAEESLLCERGFFALFFFLAVWKGSFQGHSLHTAQQVRERRKIASLCV